MSIDKNKLTPMMRQYFEVKDRYRDCIMFFRLGDFYEMFFEDAIVASKTLEIALTGRECGMEERAPMCGIPFHSSQNYISKLVENGYKVAICEQVEDVNASKGIVKRDVVRVITPGTVLEGSLLLTLTHKLFYWLCGISLIFCILKYRVDKLCNQKRL